jgi:aspartate racemase
MSAKMKIIGVLGGLGAQATMDFVARIHAVSEEINPQARGNSGYPRMVVYYHRHPPMLVDEEMKPVLPYQTHPELLEGARWLGNTADFMVITANGPHVMADEIEQAAGIPLLNMVDLAAAEVKRRGWRRVGVLALGEPRVYEQPLSARGLEMDGISGPLRDLLDQAILRLMAGHTSVEETAVALEAVEELRDRGLDGIVLGCTEIPLLLEDAARAGDLINPAQLLAEEAVKMASG